MATASTEARITAEALLYDLSHQAHDESHRRITEATRPERSSTVRPALNGVPVKFVRFTPNGAHIFFTDGTQAYCTREAFPA
jgi:hypothetical protein